MERITACTNCGAPYHRDRRLRLGRCSACYQHYQRYGDERPAEPNVKARKHINDGGHLCYGKSCPRCGDFITSRATHCASCAMVALHRGAS
jgi:hypothetical protein